MTAAAVAKRPIRSTIAARLDRLSWSPFHTRMVAGLAAARILDRLLSLALDHPIGMRFGSAGGRTMG